MAERNHGVGTSGTGRGGPDDSSLSIAAMLRAGADDELSAVEERRLEAHLEANPGDAARVEAEQQLRAAVSRVFESGPDAPAGLHDRVAAALGQLKVAEFDPDALPTRQSSEPSRTQDIPTALAASTRDRSFWSRGNVRSLSAVAAVVVVGVVAGLLMLGQPKSVPEQMVASRTAAVQFVTREHGRCFLDLAPGAEKFRLTSSEGLPAFAEDVIGREVALADILASGAENVRFIDAGPCGVPRGGRSMHLRFEVPDASGAATTGVSLFVQRYGGQQGFEESITYELDPSAAAGEDLKSPTVYSWLRDGLIYYLVIDDAQACQTVRRELGVPETIQPLTGPA